MKQFLIAGCAILFLCTSAFGQNLTLDSDAALYERPASSSAVKTTLPAGLVLDVLSEQEGWIAVSTRNGLVGWIQKPAAADAPDSDSLDDLLRSIDEAAEPGPPAESPAPMPQQDITPPAPTPSATLPSPAPSTGAAATSPTSAAVAPPPSGGVSPPPPPPPSARPPGQDGGLSFGDNAPSGPPLTNFLAGLYDRAQWFQAALDLKENYKQLNLQYGQLLGNIGQLGAWFSGIDGGGFPNIDPQDFGDFNDFFSKAEAVSTCPCDVDITTLSGGISGAVYPKVATASSPIGMYLGAFLGGATFSGDDAPESVNMAIASGEAGLFYKIGSSNSPQFIPRAAIQVVRNELICGSTAKESFACGIDDQGEAKSNIGDTTTNVFLALEMNYHGIVPGVHLTLRESPEEDKTFDSLFGFSLTLAY